MVHGPRRSSQFFESVRACTRWDSNQKTIRPARFRDVEDEQLYHVRLLHDIFGNPFRPVAFSLA